MFRHVLSLAASLSFASLLVACGNGEPVKQPVRPAMVVKPKPAAEAMEAYPGEVRARYEPELAFRIGGKVAKRLVDVGARVKKDQPLAELDRFLDRDMAFHREIARISGNPIFPAIVEAIFRWGSDYYQPLVRAPGAEQLTLAEHRRIVDAIAAHDGDAAEQAMRAHLLRSNTLYQRIAQQQSAA